MQSRSFFAKSFMVDSKCEGNALDGIATIRCHTLDSMQEVFVFNTINIGQGTVCIGRDECLIF